MIAFTVILVLIYYGFNRSNRWEIAGVNKIHLLVAFAVKLVAAFMLFYIYTYHYTDQSKSDIYKYYLDGQKLVSIANHSFIDYLRILIGFDPVDSMSSTMLNSLNYWNKINDYGLLNDNQLIIRVDSLMVILTGNSILFSSLIFSVINFTVMIFFMRSVPIKSLFQLKILFWLLFFSPTILIWTSGALKEMLMVTFLLFSLGIVLRKNKKWLILLPFSLGLLLLSKPQVGTVFTGLTVIYFVAERFKTYKQRFIYIIAFALAVLVLALNSMYLRPEYYNASSKTHSAYEKENLISRSYEENVLGNGWNILEKLKFKQMGNRDEAKMEGANSYISVSRLNGSFMNFILILPEGISNCLFRPFIWEIKNSLMVIPAIENVFILVICVMIILSLYKRDQHTSNLVYFSICYIITTAALIGILTPVLGNLVRYKVAYLPVFYVLFVLVSGQRLETYFKRLFKK